MQCITFQGKGGMGNGGLSFLGKKRHGKCRVVPSMDRSHGKCRVVPSREKEAW